MIKQFVAFSSAFIISLMLSNLAGKPLFDFIDNQSLTIFSILLGLIIGTVSVLISSISSIYSLLFSYINSGKLNAQTIEKLAILKTKIKSTINEIKDNTLFIFFAFIVNFIVVIFVKIDLPYVSWPFQLIFTSKVNVFYSISLSSIFLSLYAIYDIIRSIFTIHECQNTLLGS